MPFDSASLPEFSVVIVAFRPARGIGNVPMNMRYACVDAALFADHSCAASNIFETRLSWQRQCQGEYFQTLGLDVWDAWSFFKQFGSEFATMSLHGHVWGADVQPKFAVAFQESFCSELRAVFPTFAGLMHQ